MNSRALAALVALAVVIAGGFTFLMTRPAAPSPDGALGRSEAVDASPARPPQAEPSLGASADATEAPRAESAPRALVPGTEATPPRSGASVEVVLAGTRVGLDKARVRYAEVDAAWLGKNLPSLITTHSWLAGGRLARFVVAESLGGGRFAIERPKEAMVVIADFDLDADTFLRGYAFLGSTLEGATEHPTQIELGAPGELVVRVVGFDGAPLVEHHVDVQADFPWGPATISSATTNEFGELRLLNLDSMLAPLLGSGLVTVSTTGSDAVARTRVFAANEVPAGPLIMTVDAGCRVELSAVDDEGRSIFDREVTFELFELPLDGSASRLVRAQNGVATVDDLRPGVEVGAFERRMPFGPIEASLDRAATGKTTPCGLLRLNVPTQDRSYYVFTGRLLDEDGKGVGDARFCLRISLPDGSEYTGERGKTNADGDFLLERVMMSGRHEPLAGEVTTFQVLLDGVGPFHTLEPVAVTGVLPATVELGDLHVEPPSLVAAGRVVDTARNPIVGAQVKVGRSIHPRGIDIKDHPWIARFLMPLPGAQDVSTDANGHFEIFGPAPTVDFSVRAVATAFTESSGVVSQPGARDLELVLQAAGRMGGYLILGGTEAGSWEVVVWPEDAGAEQAFAPKPLSQSWHTNDKWAYSTPFAKSGIFAWTDVPPGRYSVRAIARAGGEEVALVSGIAVKAGEDCRDPRLQGIDVSKLLSEVTVCVRDETGQVPDGLEVGLADSKALHVACSPSEGGAKSLLLAKVPREVFVSAPGFAMQKIEVTSGNYDIVLQRGVPFVVQLPAGLDWGWGGLPLARLSSTDWHVSSAVQGAHSFGSDLRSTWILPAAGEYWLSLTSVAWGKDNGFKQLVRVPTGGFGADVATIEPSITQANISSF